LRKGDRCLVGLPPKAFYKSGGAGDSCIDPARRAFPGAWVLLELEVAKLKSADSKSSKRDKSASSKREEVAAAAAPAPASSQVPFQDLQRARVDSYGHPEDPHSDVTARMARLAAGGGGGGAGAQLAGIMNQQHPPLQQHHGHQQQHQQRDREADRELHRDPPLQPYSQQQRQPQHEEHHLRAQHQQQHQQQQPAPQGYVEHRLAVVEGQGVRNYYTDQAEDDHNYGRQQHAPPQYPQYAPVQQQPQSQTASSLNTLHQSVAAVQQSMLSLHTKLDQVGNQVTASTTLIQQQQQQALVGVGAGFGQAGGTPGMGMGLMGAGMGGFMSPLQQQQQQQLQFQQQMMLLQQQQSQQPSQLTAPASAARLKTEELVGTLQALLTEYEAARAGGGAQRGDSAAREAESKEQLRALRATVERLEERNDGLQVTTASG
jgi:hypothetical protein